MTNSPGLHGQQLLPRDVLELLYRHGWMEPLNMVRMLATLIAESDLFTEAVGTVNPDGSQDFGLFQLTDSHWPRFASTRDDYIAKAFDPEQAAGIARVLWSEDVKAGGSGFRPWAAFGKTRYLAVLANATVALHNWANTRLSLPLAH